MKYVTTIHFIGLKVLFPLVSNWELRFYANLHSGHFPRFLDHGSGPDTFNDGLIDPVSKLPLAYFDIYVFL